MVEHFLKISPVILLALIGFILKKIKFFNNSDADLFLKIVFYIAMPGLIFSSFDQLIFDLKLLKLPLIAAGVLLINFILSYLIGHKIRLKNKTLGTFVLASSILNTGFTLPFVIAILGNEGVRKLIIFDLGNVALVITLLYYFACKLGSNDYSIRNVINKFLASTPLWALLIAFVINITNNHLPEFLLQLSSHTGNMVIPLIMFSLGIYFNPKIKYLKLSSVVIFLRMGFGFVIGLVIVSIFQLKGIERIIVIVGASTPVGFNTLTFSSLENLDKEFAASVLSYAIFIGIFSVPFILLILN